MTNQGVTLHVRRLLKHIIDDCVAIANVAVLPYGDSTTVVEQWEALYLPLRCSLAIHRTGHWCEKFLFYFHMNVGQRRTISPSYHKYSWGSVNWEGKTWRKSWPKNTESPDSAFIKKPVALCTQDDAVKIGKRTEDRSSNDWRTRLCWRWEIHNEACEKLRPCQTFLGSPPVGMMWTLQKHRRYARNKSYLPAPSLQSRSPSRTCQNPDITNRLWKV